MGNVINAKVKLNSGRIITSYPLTIRSRTSVGNTSRLSDLDDVSITQPPSDRDILQYNDDTNVWENNPNIDGGEF